MTCYVDGNPLPNVTWLVEVNQNYEYVDGQQFDVCGLAVIKGWVSSGLGLDEDDLTLVLECTASSNNNKTSQKSPIRQNRGTFNKACKATARTTQTTGSVNI